MFVILCEDSLCVPLTVRSNAVEAESFQTTPVLSFIRSTDSWKAAMLNRELWIGDREDVTRDALPRDNGHSHREAAEASVRTLNSSPY